jgi:DNA-binding NarL/FixJ family response regulator
MSLKVRVAISDVPLRQALCGLLEREPDLVVLTTTPSSDDVGADLLLVDSEPAARELIRLLKQTHPRTRTIVLVAQPTGEAIHAALSAGAAGVVAKAQPARELLGAVRVVAQGGSYVCFSAASDAK